MLRRSAYDQRMNASRITSALLAACLGVAALTTTTAAQASAAVPTRASSHDNYAFVMVVPEAKHRTIPRKRRCINLRHEFRFVTDYYDSRFEGKVTTKSRGKKYASNKLTVVASTVPKYNSVPLGARVCSAGTYYVTAKGRITDPKRPGRIDKRVSVTKSVTVTKQR